MCLKPRVKDIERYDFLEKILEDSRRKITELEETEEKEMLFAYELLKAKQYDMKAIDTISKTKLTIEQYSFIANNYDILISKYPQTKERVKKTYELLEKAELKYFLVNYTCENCKNKIKEELDVKDLCNDCKSNFERYKSQNNTYFF